MEAVYDDLSDTMQRFLSGLKAYHCNKSVHGQSAATGRSRPHPSEKDATLLEAEHPVIQTNPVTGRKFVYVNKVFTKAIIGMTPRESTMLLEFLFDQVRDPEYQARVRWFPGTVIMWNNRSCTHRLIVDRPTSERRILHRLSISGGIPS
jgi:alpha-ketoglutarate-dependent taurine dioxygenase